MTTPKEPKTVEVVLLDVHTHKGKPYKKGDKIKVTPGQRDWLVNQNKVAPPAGSTK